MKETVITTSLIQRKTDNFNSAKSVDFTSFARRLNLVNGKMKRPGEPRHLLQSFFQRDSSIAYKCSHHKHPKYLGR